MTDLTRTSGGPAAGESPGHRAWKRLAGNRLAAAAAAYLALVTALCFLAPFLNSHGANQGSDDQFAPPGMAHWFGGDIHGRDLFVRVFAGARLSLFVGAVGAGVSLAIGATWGMIAGYAGGRIDGAMMRAVDVLYTLPGIVVVIVLMAVFEPLAQKAVFHWGPDAGPPVRLVFLFAGLGSVSWLTMARIVRGEVLALRNRPYVLASRALGAGGARILWRHIAPNIAGVVIVYLTLSVPAIVLYESFLSFLGLGVQPPQASLGTLIAEGASQINPLRVYWWLLAFPAGLLASTLLALTLVGDGVRDALDPRAD